MRLLRRVFCLFGRHATPADTVLHWGAVEHFSGNRIARPVTELCPRCGRAFGWATWRLEDGRWVA